MPEAVVRHPAQPERRAAPRPRSWWVKSWVRALEEAAYGHADLRTGRALARSGRIGAITLSADGFVASVEDPDGMWTASGALAPLGEPEVEGLCEALEAESGRIGALLSGDLPHGLVEHAEEAGVELLPFSGELATTCTCQAWADPCVHALAVLYQLGWVLEDDPLVLMHLRGLSRAELLARLERRASVTADGGTDPDEPDAPDLDTAADAALRATRMLELTEQGEAFDHLL